MSNAFANIIISQTSLIFKSIKKNHGEVLFRLSSKLFIVLMSLLLDSSLFGSLVLVFVNEAIFSNILRFGQDRRLLSLEDRRKIPLKEYFILSIISILIYFFFTIFYFKLNFLLLVIPLSLFSTIYFLMNVRNRIVNLKVYNRLRNFELFVRFFIAPIGLTYNIETFLVILIFSYLVMIFLNFKFFKKTFTILKIDLTSFWKFTSFTFHSAIAFLITGVDKILITKNLGIAAQGDYSKIFSMIGLVSLIYLFLSFIFEPKFYNSKNIKEVENNYLKLCYLLIIPASVIIYFFSFYFQIIDISDTLIFCLLACLFMTYPYEFSKIYILTKFKEINKIVKAGIIQLLIILVLTLFLKNYFSVVLMILVLISSKIIGIIYLTKKIKWIK
ncbi:MAG: hypothetical protein VYD59_01850 [Bacteroidota bacterium]|nr:hypothetical protein [Bacteroidota bacterium]